MPTQAKRTLPPLDPDDTDDFAGTQEWVEVDTDYGEKLTWEEGTVFIGEFVKVRRDIVMDDGGTADAFEFTAKGDKFYTWPPARLAGALNRAIEDGALSTGQAVRIECTGTMPSQRKGMSPSKTFRLSIRPN